MTQTTDHLDLAQLLGFGGVSETKALNFGDDALAPRLGAKVDIVEPSERSPMLDAALLFGFEAMAGKLDFADAKIATRAGAMVGIGETVIKNPELDVTRLMGFETSNLETTGYRGNSIGAAVLEPSIAAGGVDVAPHLGAKVGIGEATIESPDVDTQAGEISSSSI